MRDGHLLHFLALLLVGLLGCDRVVAAGGVDQTHSRLYIVLVDLSASRSPDVLQEDQHFLNDVIQNLNFGDPFRSHPDAAARACRPSKAVGGAHANAQGPVVHHGS
jgi:hypothetical protein